MMKTKRANAQETTFDEIVETLKSVPEARLGIVRDFVHALAAPRSKKGQRQTRAGKRVSLVETPFCGMWKDRKDIPDGQTFARQLRRRLETRGDRGKNAR